MTKLQWMFNLGVALVGLGGGLGVAFFIYCLEAQTSFWTWPGILAAAMASFGFLAMSLILFASAPEIASQTQQSGANSTNYQAGRDMHIRGSRDE